MFGGRSTKQRGLGAAMVVVFGVLVGACGGGGDGAPVLSEAGERGKRTALAAGCAGCHGTNGQGGVGPTWIGRLGTSVELIDGSTVVVDNDYLTRSIAEPEADLLADFVTQMPRNRLSEAEIADVIAYINDLNP